MVQAERQKTDIADNRGTKAETNLTSNDADVFGLGCAVAMLGIHQGDPIFDAPRQIFVGTRARVNCHGSFGEGRRACFEVIGRNANNSFFLRALMGRVAIDGQIAADDVDSATHFQIAAQMTQLWSKQLLEPRKNLWMAVKGLPIIVARVLLQQLLANRLIWILRGYELCRTSEECQQ